MRIAIKKDAEFIDEFSEPRRAFEFLELNHSCKYINGEYVNHTGDKKNLQALFSDYGYEFLYTKNLVAPLGWQEVDVKHVTISDGNLEIFNGFETKTILK